MKRVLKEKFNFWISQYPDSYHSCDNERLFDAIKFAYRNNMLTSLHSIDWVDLVKTNQPEWCDDYIKEFVEEWSGRIDWFVYLLNSMQEDGTIYDCRVGTNKFE